jgi:hypothetical protein
VNRSKPAGGGTSNRADIIAIIGASGTGKSSYIKGELLPRALRASQLILIWSPLERTDNYAGFVKGEAVSKITDLIAALKAGKRAIVYAPQGTDAEVKTQFDRFCRIVWELENAFVLVEELSRVTMASWAPPAWKNLSTAGRHRGHTLAGTSQRPANIDKDFLGNCTEIRCYRVNYDADAKVMADSLALKSNAAGNSGVTLLRSLPNFHYFHKNPDLSVREGVNKTL